MKKGVKRILFLISKKSASFIIAFLITGLICAYLIGRFIWPELGKVKRENIDAKKYHSAWIRLTSSDTDDIYPRFSPDGKYITYLSNKKLHIMDLKKREDIFASEEQFEAEIYPVVPYWSPNSEKLAFHYERDGEYYLLIFDLRTERINSISNCALSVWSPDSTELVVRRLKASGIWIVSSEGIVKKVLLSEEEMENKSLGTPREWSWASDGKIYVLSSYLLEEAKWDRFRNKTDDINVINVNTLEVKNLLHTDADIEYLSLSPDSKRLFYTFSPSFIKGAMWKAPLWLTAMDPESGEEKRLTRCGVGRDWSPDGTKILYYSLTSGLFSLYIIEVDTGRKWSLEGTTQVTFDNADWSPDGKYIAIAVPQDDTNGDGTVNTKDNKNIVLMPIDLD